MTTPNGAERETGLPAVGPVPWGSHFCIFYETKKDLCDILVPYFRTGLENHEACFSYVGSDEFRTVNDAKEVVREALPGFDRFSKRGAIEIVPREKVFTSNGHVDTSRAVARLKKKLRGAIRHGFEGLRVHGGSAWVRVSAGESGFCQYEREVDSMLAGERMVVACTFPLMLTGADQILDVVRTHHFAVTMRHGLWKRVEIGDIKAARKEATRALEKLTFRQREVLRLIAEGQNTKEIAGLLGISVKTVEAHRLQLMRRLKIHDVPGLVRLAIRTGLVSAEL
jgi:DNA-binding CsgD family transcriptional regulator